MAEKNLRLKFSKIYSVGKLLRISIHLKIEPTSNYFQIKSNPKPPKSNFFSRLNPRKSLKRLRFSEIFNKFQRRTRKIGLVERRRNGLRRIWLLLWFVLFLFLVLIIVFFGLIRNNFFWKCIWNYASPSSQPRFLYQISKVIFNSMGFVSL